MAIVARHILTGFFAVLVLLRAAPRFYMLIHQGIQ